MNEKEIIKKFNELFIMTRKKYLILYPNGEYRTFELGQSDKVKKLNDGTVKRHLEGKATLGVFAGGEFTKFICFDVDVTDEVKAKWTVYSLVNGLIEIGIPEDRIYISTSGSKGYHVDIYFSNPIKNKLAYQLYLLALNTSQLLNIDFGKVEYRPNSTLQGVKLPLGIHFKSKKKSRCWYVDYSKGLKPIEDFEYILSIQQLDVEILYQIFECEEDLYKENEVIQVEETRDMIKSKVKPLQAYCPQPPSMAVLLPAAVTGQLTNGHPQHHWHLQWTIWLSKIKTENSRFFLSTLFQENHSSDIMHFSF